MALFARLENGQLTLEQHFAKCDRRRFLTPKTMHTPKCFSECQTPLLTQSNASKEYAIHNYEQSNVKKGQSNSPSTPVSAMEPPRTSYGHIGWRLTQPGAINYSKHVKILSCPKKVLAELDRFQSEVYCYSLGKQPEDLNKKYGVDMQKYNRFTPKKPQYEMSADAKSAIVDAKINDVPISAKDVRKHKAVVYKYRQSPFPKEITCLPDMEGIRNRVNRSTMIYKARMSPVNSLKLTADEEALNRISFLQTTRNALRARRQKFGRDNSGSVCRTQRSATSNLLQQHESARLATEPAMRS